MNNVRLLTTFIMVFLLPHFAWSRSLLLEYNVEEALTQMQARQQLVRPVSLYFQGQRFGHVVDNLGITEASRKNNAFNIAGKQACQQAFVAALKSLSERALSLGGNAVVNIRSAYANRSDYYQTTFQCGAGDLMVGVALTGEVVYLDDYDY
jgi:hypothetical protein